MKKHLKLPKFKDEDEERNFWSKTDLGAYYEAKDFKHVPFPNLKPTTQSISIRIPLYIIDQVKVNANKLNIPYQTLMKQYIAEAAWKK